MKIKHIAPNFEIEATEIIEQALTICNKIDYCPDCPCFNPYLPKKACSCGAVIKYEGQVYFPFEFTRVKNN